MRDWAPRRAVSGVACLVTLAGCGSERPEQASAGWTPAPGLQNRVTMVYECDAGFTFVATVRNDTAWVFLPSATLSLPHVESGSGVRYGDGTTTLWTKGEEALLDTPSDSVRGCVNNRSRAVWEHAKLGGADFRAVGSEPGWHLQISYDSIVLVTDYGESRHAFATPAPEAHTAERRSVYRTSAKGHVLEVRLEGSECRDTMSGETFETTVTVTLDGRTLRGCGRALH